MVRKSLTQALWITFVATALISKGKSYTLTMVPLSELTHGFFDVNYIFPFYMHQGILLLLVVQLIRRGQWFLQSQRHLLVPATIWLVLFQLNLIWQSLFQTYSLVILLSAVQFFQLIIVFALPTILQPVFPSTSNLFRTTMLILTITFMFQIGWAFLQIAHQGPTGHFIETKLPNINFGVVTSEDSSTLRTTGWFADPALLGTFLICIITMRLWHLKDVANQQNKYNVAIEMLLIFFGFIGVATSMNRILIILSLFFVFYGLHLLQKNNTYQKMRLVALVMITCVLILMSPILANRFKSIVTSFNEYGSGRYRYEQFIYSLRISAVRPEGVGINLSPLALATGFSNESRSIDAAHAHNLILQLLVEVGVVGLAFFSLFILTIFKPFILRREPFNQFAAAALAYLVCAQFYPIFINQSELLVYLFIFLGLTQAKSITAMSIKA